MSKYKTYPEYKESGIVWLGDIPEYWKVKKMSHVCCFQEGPGIMAKDFHDTGIPLVRISGMKNNVVSLDGCNYLSPHKVESTWKHFCLNNGDLLVSASASTGIVCEVDSKSTGAIPYTGLIRFISNPRILQAFLKYFLKSSIFDSQIDLQKTGSTIQHYGPSHLNNIHLSLPTVPEQQAIASFLDYETGKLDELIAKQQELIALLEEKRQAVISHAVTKGLDSSVPMKSSSIEWLGDIPEHWEVSSLRWYIRVFSGEYLDNKKIESQPNKSCCIEVVGGNGCMGFTYFSNQDFSLVIGRVGALCGNVHIFNKPVWVTDNALIVNYSYKLNKDYLALVLRSMNLNKLANQNTLPLITGTMLKDQVILIPSNNEQQEIVDYLDKATAKIDNLIGKAKSAIDLMRERRTALISAAVTGKIDVRDFEPVNEEQVG